MFKVRTFPSCIFLALIFKIQFWPMPRNIFETDFTFVTQFTCDCFPVTSLCEEESHRFMRSLNTKRSHAPTGSILNLIKTIFILRCVGVVPKSQS